MVRFFPIFLPKERVFWHHRHPPKSNDRIVASVTDISSKEAREEHISSFADVQFIKLFTRNHVLPYGFEVESGRVRKNRNNCNIYRWVGVSVHDRMPVLRQIKTYIL